MIDQYISNMLISFDHGDLLVIFWHNMNLINSVQNYFYIHSYVNMQSVRTHSVPCSLFANILSQGSYKLDGCLEHVTQV